MCRVRDPGTPELKGMSHQTLHWAQGALGKGRQEDCRGRGKGRDQGNTTGWGTAAPTQTVTACTEPAQVWGGGHSPVCETGAFYHCQLLPKGKSAFSSRISLPMKFKHKGRPRAQQYMANAKELNCILDYYWVIMLFVRKIFFYLTSTLFFSYGFLILCFV